MVGRKPEKRRKINKMQNTQKSPEQREWEQSIGECRKMTTKKQMIEELQKCHVIKGQCSHLPKLSLEDIKSLYAHFKQLGLNNETQNDMEANQ